MAASDHVGAQVEDTSPLAFLAELRRSGRLTITAKDEAIIAAVTSGDEWSDEMDALAGPDASVSGRN